MYARKFPFMQGPSRSGKAKPLRLGTLLLRGKRHLGLLIPAGLYSVNSYLKFIMLLYFRPTTAKMLGNLKVRLRGWQLLVSLLRF